MDGPRDCLLSNVKSQTISYDIAYMWNLKKWYKRTYLQNRNRVTDVENKLMITKGQSGGKLNWETGIDIYTLLYTK